jgi:UDP-N-acetylglucosamine--N-acetylmuramyl-(pentapeptide) pyrophosphoryl-undecaprenol N-acetylglucosamine transferase
MEKVPQAGFEIRGLSIAGFNRGSLIKNIGLPFKLIKSFFQVRTIFNEFKPDVAIGVGGYSSFPVLRLAQARGIPTFIHESNSFAGRSNIILGKKATKIFTGSDGMEKFFPAQNIMITGNPVRAAISHSKVTHDEAIKFFDLDPSKKTLLVVGGSLGARSINEAVLAGLDALVDSGLQVIWQTGKPFASTAKQAAMGKKDVWVNEFITQMEMAYAAADMVVARSGAMTVAELCVVKRPVLFVPYPFAAEDHQTVNAMALVKRNAALMISDNEAAALLIKQAIDLSADGPRRTELSNNIGLIAVTNADEVIATEVLKHVKHKKA